MEIETFQTPFTHVQRNEDPFSLIAQAPIPPRLMWIIHYRQVKNVNEVCRKFSISRKTFYKWLKRYEKSGGDPLSLGDESRRPHRSPRATPSPVVATVLQIHHATGYGQRRLKRFLWENFNIDLSERTIWKLIKKHANENRTVRV